MMLENSAFPENSSAAAADKNGNEFSVTGVFGEEEKLRESEDVGGDRSSAGNRWPREETLALLKVRSDMDIAFRDSGIKAPLWDEVSRKLAELGYHRNGKKCKEKFENLYKYYRRTKDGRSSQPNSKSYRFFEQLEALDTKINQNSMMPLDPSTTSTTSSSGKENSKGMSGDRKKRKFSDLFEGLIMKVIEKQESLQRKLLETIERHDHERLKREEAWRVQENARIKREHELLVQERSVASARDAAVVAFLQKFSSEEKAIGTEVQLQDNLLTTPREINEIKNVEKQENGSNGGFDSSSRWPKAEVDALIKFRSSTFDQQYHQENGSKGPLWEEISSEMKKIGYNRSAKRCKEKWENINKYFKRVRESNKKRPGDSKTCPYFPQLEALYKEKFTKKVVHDANNSVCDFKPEDLLMQMMGDNGKNGGNFEQMIPDENRDDVDDDGQEEEEDEDEDEDDDDEDDERDNYQIVANDTSSIAIME